jgi:aconitate hydratase
MGMTIAQKIIAAHKLDGDMTVGSQVALRIDQTLTQDATGTMAYLELETISSTAAGWRKLKNYYDMRDVLGMWYME